MLAKYRGITAKEYVTGLFAYALVDGSGREMVGGIGTFCGSRGVNVRRGERKYSSWRGRRGVRACGTFCSIAEDEQGVAELDDPVRLFFRAYPIARGEDAIGWDTELDLPRFREWTAEPSLLIETTELGGSLDKFGEASEGARSPGMTVGGATELSRFEEID